MPLGVRVRKKTAGQNAFAWHDIDAELAQLTYDSTRLTEEAVPTRAQEEAGIRVLTFTSAQAGLQIELEVQEDALAGQILPMQSAAIELQTLEDPLDVALRRVLRAMKV